MGELLTSTEAFQNLTVLCDRFGSRFGGTEGEKGAIKYLLSKYEEYGLENVHKEEFPFNAWVRGDHASLEVLSPVPQQLKCIALPYNIGSTIEGELVYLGHGTPDDYASLGEDALRGKIVMVSALSPDYWPRGMHRGEKLGRAIKAGAIGFIWMRWEPGMLEETGAARMGRPAEIPCIGISREVGESLVRMGAKGPVKVKIHTTDTVMPATTANVVAEIKGRSQPDKVIVVGAHFDGHDIAPGAMDDGAGAMVVLETARALAMHKDLVGKTLRFIAFPVEELSIGGSYNYVSQHEDELDEIEFMLNLDAVGRTIAYSTPGIAIYGKWVPLINFFRSIGKDMNMPLQAAHDISMHSDHFPFQLKGLPTGTLKDLSGSGPGVRGFGHTVADTLDKVPPYGLEYTAMVVARILLHMSNRTDWPVGRITEEEVQEALGKEHLEVLELEGRWPFGPFLPELVK